MTTPSPVLLDADLWQWGFIQFMRFSDMGCLRMADMILREVLNG